MSNKVGDIIDSVRDVTREKRRKKNAFFSNYVIFLYRGCVIFVRDVIKLIGLMCGWYGGSFDLFRFKYWAFHMLCMALPVIMSLFGYESMYVMVPSWLINLYGLFMVIFMKEMIESIDKIRDEKD